MKFRDFYITSFIYKLVFILSVQIFSACQNDHSTSKNNTSKSKDSISNKISPALNSLSNINYTFVPDTTKTPFCGHLFSSVKWRDARGENIIILSSKEADTNCIWLPDKKLFVRNIAVLFAYHFILNKSGIWAKYWELSDYKSTPQKNYSSCWQFQPGSLGISDIDTNGIGESTFFYTSRNVGCNDFFCEAKLVFHADSNAVIVSGGMIKRKTKVNKSPNGIPAHMKSNPQFATHYCCLATPLITMNYSKYSTFALRSFEFIRSFHEAINHPEVVYKGPDLSHLMR